MKDLFPGALILLLGVLVVIYNKPIAKDGVTLSYQLQASWRRLPLKHELWFARAVIIVWGIGASVFGLAMMLGFTK
jgi:hypothetical protein